jgi:hypothetical protein
MRSANFARYASAHGTEPPRTGTGARSRPCRRRGEVCRGRAEAAAIWNARQAGGRKLWFYPTIAAIAVARSLAFA